METINCRIKNLVFKDSEMLAYLDNICFKNLSTAFYK